MRRALFAVVTGLSTLAISVGGLLGGLLRAGPGWYDHLHRWWARLEFAVAGISLEVEGADRIEPGRPLVIMSNHQSNLDPWALMAALPVSLRFVAKRELARIPLFGRACRAAGHVFIDRSDPVSASAAIRVLGGRLAADGLALVLFPEGTRSPDGTLGRFKRGSFALALELGADVVPVAIAGSHEAWPPGEWPRPGRIRVVCAEPIRVHGTSPADRDRLLRQTHETIAAELAAAPSVPPDRAALIGADEPA